MWRLKMVRCINRIKPGDSFDHFKADFPREESFLQKSRLMKLMAYRSTRSTTVECPSVIVRYKSTMVESPSPSIIELNDVKPVHSVDAEDKQQNAEDKQQIKWDNKLQYLLTLIGFAVGFGNIWRFPYLCQTYGGGAFLIPYVIALVFVGLPLLYLELAIGQKLRKGSIGSWKHVSPFLGGVGISCMFVSFLITLFYNSVLAWVMWYFYNSFKDPLPWSQCPVNDTNLARECEKSTSVNFFWYRQTLNITTDIETNGSLQLHLVACLAIAWATVYICFIKGIKSMGKAVYLTTTLPYVVLTIFLVRALTLPGAKDGLVYLFTPDWEILKNPQVWLDAAAQIFFSLSVGFGGLIAFSSYNNEHNNCEKDALLVGITNSATSLYASIAIFSILGFKANNELQNCKEYVRVFQEMYGLTYKFDHESNVIYKQLEMEYPGINSTLLPRECNLSTFLDQSASGTGLAFITFTQAVLEMPYPRVWATLFFLMLLSLGLSSMFGTLEGVLNPIRELDIIPKWLSVELWTGFVCLTAFLISLIFTMGSGNYWVEVFNTYVGSIPLLFIAFFEVIGVSYVRGMKRFSDDIFLMTGKHPCWYWKICWTIISPAMIISVLIAYVVLEVEHDPTFGTWNPDYELFPQTEVKPYPDWLVSVSALLSSVPLSPILLVALYYSIYKSYNVARYMVSMENSLQEQQHSV
ncbi:sodium-dependent neutral amino acid transporter B(0)AT3-like [Syngnathus scovelli]|uniref:sodium-dependent neutral amino acid transporter B(0)AT3-like n=1 Tax=Syngnathus scovelli TaxID=161590 RepID=UPI00210FCB05|nr:sodium-dependent neutral amino acid transporter B(0)AT3-like [Syngnathus scovelli]